MGLPTQPREHVHGIDIVQGLSEHFSGQHYDRIDTQDRRTLWVLGGYMQGLISGQATRVFRD